MNAPRIRSLALLAFLLPLPAMAALAPVGPPLEISTSPFCASPNELEVVATPKGAFEVLWVDDDFSIKGQRFARNLVASDIPRNLLFLHGGLFISDIQGTWTGRYEIAMNGADFGDFPDDPAVAYRLALDLEGRKVLPAARRRAANFSRLIPASNGDSLLFRGEPPIFGSGECLSQGLLARRINALNQSLSPDSRLNQGASPVSGPAEVEPLANNTFIAVYRTCERFKGLVARRLDANGAPLGRAINLPLPGRQGATVLAARDANHFATATAVVDLETGVTGIHLWAVVNGKIAAPHRLPSPAGASVLSQVLDMAPASDGGYLLVFQAREDSDPVISRVYAQKLNQQGLPVRQAVPITESVPFTSLQSKVASLPSNRFLVVTRQQQSNETSCSERLFGTVLADD